MKPLLAVVFALFVPAAHAQQVAAPPLFGGFTDPEKVEILRLYTGFKQTNTIGRELNPLVAECGLGRKPLLIKQATAVMEVTLTAGEALAITLGANPENMGSPAFPTYPLQPRVDQMKRAFMAVDRAASKAQEAQVNAATAMKRRGLPAGCGARLRTIEYLWRAEVGPLFVNFDRHLTYFSPIPRVAPVINGVHTFVGPHGDFVSGQGLLLWGGINYPNRYVESAIEGLKVATAGAAVLGRPFHAAADLQNVAAHSMLLAAGIKVFPDDPTDDFCRILRVSRLLAGSKRQVVAGEPGQDHAMSFRFHGMQEALADVAPYIPIKWLQDAMFRLTDAWKHIDWAIWELFRFPNPGRCGTVVVP